MKKLILLGIVMFGAATVASVFVKNQSNESDGKPDKKPVQFNHEQIAKPPVDAKIIKDAAFINEVQKTQGIAKAIARKFGFLKHSSPEVDKLNGVYRSTYFEVPFVVIDTNIICALKLPMFSGSHISRIILIACQFGGWMVRRENLKLWSQFMRTAI